MPELPEVEALSRFLDGKIVGEQVTRVEVAAISALKTFDPPIDALAGRTVVGTGRRGKYLLLDTDGIWLVLHLARGGWIRWYDQLPAGRAKPGKGPLALRLGFSHGGGFDVTEAGTEKRLSIWVARDPAAVEPVAALGPDPLDPAFDVAALAAVLAGQTGQLKSVLTTQSVIAGVGNAYSDEVLHAAGLSPFKKASGLTADDLERLHTALRTLLGEAVEHAKDLPAAGLKVEKKSRMRVHGRTGQPCPVCGDTVREVSFATKSLQYCPTCQTGGRPLADRRYSKFLK